MRIRFRRKASLKAQLDLAARQLRDEAETFPGHKRDSMLRRARQSQITTQIAVWLTSQNAKALR